jgi:REP element-mobilizing transposase RayT
MARKPRIHSPDAVYHVILRGNGKQDIFFEDQDRYRFYLLLQEGTERFHHKVHAFCLMTNHIHLVVQVADIALSRIMQNLSFRYTRWVNWRHNRSGHLFQGRYKAVLVDGDSYLLELVRYVHLNPVRAKMVEAPKSYPWSSHRAYLGIETLPWLATEPGLAMFSRNRAQAVKVYSEFIRDGLTEGHRPEFHGEGNHDSRILGDDGFVERMAGEGAAPFGTVSINDLLTAVCRRYSVTTYDIARPGKERPLSRVRSMAAWIVQDESSVTLKQLAERTGRDVSSLSAAAQRMQKRSRMMPELLREKEELIIEITKCKA